MTSLVIVTLATLGVWDVLRRALPWRLPATAGKCVCFVTAYLLYTRVPFSIVQAFAVVGGMMILANIVTLEPFVPWGSAFAEYVRSRRTLRSNRDVPAPPRVGNRVPKL